MAKIKITILNWEKYNPRNDVKNGSWIRLEIDVCTGPSLFGLSIIERAVWIFLLTQCAKDRGTAEITPEWCAHNGFEANIVNGALEKLENKGCLKAAYEHVTPAYVDVAPAYATNERTNERNVRTREETLSDESLVTDGKDVSKKEKPEEFDEVRKELERLYSLYPLKKGKSRGMATLCRKQWDNAALCELEKAVRNYAKSRLGQDPKFTKHFSTFVNGGSNKNRLAILVVRTDVVWSSPVYIIYRILLKYN